MYLFFVLLFSTPCYAVNGKLSYVMGDVLVLSPRAALGTLEQSEKAKLTQLVHGGSTLKTLDHSAAVVTLEDGSQVKLNENTEITLGAEPKVAEINLKTGGIFSKIQKQGPRLRFLVRTRSATFGVRGTEFFTSWGKQKNSDPDLWMCVNEGLVEIESVGTAQKTLVKEGLGVFLTGGKEVTTPKPYAWTKSLNWNMDPEKGSVENKTSMDSAYKNLVEQDYD
jgi:ferric-dicitrate binding protein FerR (iron transport regulator)